jgi:hypothetical protein
VTPVIFRLFSAHSTAQLMVDGTVFDAKRLSAHTYQFNSRVPDQTHLRPQLIQCDVDLCYPIKVAGFRMTKAFRRSKRAANLPSKNGSIADVGLAFFSRS